MAWPGLESIVKLGTNAAMPERLARNVRIANGLALITCLLSLASFPFDVLAGPRWFELYDAVGVMIACACLGLNALGRTTASRVVLLFGLDVVFVCSSTVLGHVSDQRVLFFALAVAPFLAFDLSERRPLASLSMFAIACYVAVEVVGQHRVTAPSFYDVTAYRVYSAILVFAGLIGGVWHFKRETRRAEQALLARERLLDDVRARTMAASRMSALGEMASGVAHEIRNPLATLQLAATQLESVHDAEDLERASRAISRIRSAVRRIARIIESLLFFSRDATKAPFAAADLDQILGDTLELCHERFLEHGIDLEVVRDASKPISIECRAGELSQVLVNLLGNAFDAVLEQSERWVRLEVTPLGDEVEIAVSDSGRGIPPALREKIFEPFFTTKAPGVGTGLGLSVSRGIVDVHQGRLFVDDTAQHTRFVIRLPLHHATRAEEDARRTALARTSGRRAAEISVHPA